MLEIEKVKGIILSEDGIPHPFGTTKMRPVNELEDDNYHDIAFINDIVHSDWFKSTGYQYDESSNITAQAIDMCSNGFTIILNGCSVNSLMNETYCYIMYTPSKISDNTKEYLGGIYSEFKNLIEKNDAIFAAEPFENNDYVFNSECNSITEFYDKLDIPKNSKSK